METLKNSSMNIDEPVAITPLAKAVGNCSGRFTGWSQDGLTIRIGNDLKVGSVVKLESGSNLMVAEVRDCAADGKEFSAGLCLWEMMEKSELERFQREMALGSAPKQFLAA